MFEHVSLRRGAQNTQIIQTFGDYAAHVFNRLRKS
jgi:hypothetical protein